MPHNIAQELYQEAIVFTNEQVLTLAQADISNLDKITTGVVDPAC
jgi:hypothetical protein